MNRGDPHTTTWATARRDTATDRARRGVTTCGCGAEYTPGPDGIRRHQRIHGHRPTPATEED